MRFLGNMGISPLTIAYLRANGHEAKRLHEEGLDTLPDPEVLEKARTEGSILLTSDLDFGQLAVESRLRSPSVIIFRLENMRPESVNGHIRRVIASHEKDLESGCIISVSEKWIRVRRFPL